ncbi:MAG: hypothetical protein GWN00_01440 [Aliifodinibius sp.]|nr:hypothetical protein [Fodinibius sp.]NIY23526.1 hypothetical protein [Fodinibius sp.]
MARGMVLSKYHTLNTICGNELNLIQLTATELRDIEDHEVLPVGSAWYLKTPNNKLTSKAPEGVYSALELLN